MTDFIFRFEIKNLVEVCSSMINEGKLDEIQQVAGEEENEDNDRNLEDLQHLLTEENTEENTKEEEERRNDSSQEEISNEDYNDIMCTQRKKYSVTEGRVDTEDSGKENSEEDLSGVESDVSEGEISLFFHDDSFDGTTTDPGKEEDVSQSKESEGEENEGVTEDDVEIISQTEFSAVKGGADLKVESEQLKNYDRKMEEDMDIEKEIEEDMNKPIAKDHPDVEKLGRSILFEDEDLIIYSDTEDTPTSLESKLNNQSQSLHSHLMTPDRSGQADSPLIVDSECSSHSSLEIAGVLAEGGGGGVGSPVPQALDSSGFDLFESPVQSETSNSQNEPSISNFKSSKLSREELSPDASTHLQALVDVETPVKGSTSEGYSRIIRRSNLNKVRYETPVDEQNDEDRATNTRVENCVNDDDKIVSPNSVTSIHSECDDDEEEEEEDDKEVSLIEEDDQVFLPKKTAVSPVFHQPPRKDKKNFKFTRTKPVSADLEKKESPGIGKGSAADVCDIVDSFPELSPSKEQKSGVEDEQETGNINDMYEVF